MNQKLLWKIESLWEQCQLETSKSSFSMSSLYSHNTSLYNHEFQRVEDFSYDHSENYVHEDVYGKYYGLVHSQVKKIHGKYVYLFDNHNKILQAFLEYFEIKKESFDVVHIDAHEDDAVFPAEKPHHLDIKNIQEYINQTRISDFFDFMSESNIIQDIHRYTKSNDFQMFKKPQKPYILSLDIDIFGPEGDFVDLESKVKIIAEAWAGAEVVCIAMSPGFIDQKFAREVVEVFMGE